MDEYSAKKKRRKVCKKTRKPIFRREINGNGIENRLFIDFTCLAQKHDHNQYSGKIRSNIPSKHFTLCMKLLENVMCRTVCQWV